MEFTGKIIAVLEPRSGVSQRTGSTWKSQEYVIEELISSSQFAPRRMCFNVWGEDKINAMNIQIGQELTVSFDINAREYQGRWYNDLRAWKVDPAQQAQPVAAAPQQSAPQQPTATPFPPAETATEQTNDFTSGSEEENLPF